MEPIRILVIDDEPVICDGCRLTLADRGFVVDSCNSVTKGLEMHLGEEYDLGGCKMKKKKDLNQECDYFSASRIDDIAWI